MSTLHRSFALAALAALLSSSACSRDKASSGTGPSAAPPASSSVVAARASAAPSPSASVMSELGRDLTETRLYSGAVANLTGDGKTYLVVGGYTGGTDGRAADIAVYKEDAGAWTLEWQSTWRGGHESMVRNVSIVDLDKDGKDEIVVLGRVGETSHKSEAQLKVLGVKNGGLAVLAETTWQSGTYTHGYGLDTADLDADGTPEIVSGGFFFDGTRENAEVRVWKYKPGALAVVAKTSFGDPAFTSARINSVAIGDLDGDGKPEIVVAGRDGGLKPAVKTDTHAPRHEQGMIAAFALKNGAIEPRGKFAWKKGTSSRLRAIELVDVDGDHHAKLIAAGQVDDDGKPCLGFFKFDKDTFTLASDASWGSAATQGEIKDIVILGKGAQLRIATTGPVGAKPQRQGQVQTWKIAGGNLVLDKSITSTNGDETRARALVAWPTPTGMRLLTVGHAKSDKQMVGQLLDWGKGT